MANANAMSINPTHFRNSSIKCPPSLEPVYHTPRENARCSSVHYNRRHPRAPLFDPETNVTPLVVISPYGPTHFVLSRKNCYLTGEPTPLAPTTPYLKHVFYYPRCTPVQWTAVQCTGVH